MRMLKHAHVVGHKFDCLPSHVTVAAHGTGATVRVALQRAVGALLRDRRLRYRRFGEFQLSVVITEQRVGLAGVAVERPEYVGDNQHQRFGGTLDETGE